MPFLLGSGRISLMLAIRLQRVGRKHEPKFRVVLTDSKNGPKSGKFLELLGSYDARIKNDVKQLKTDRIKALMANGAQLSDTLHNFLVHEKVIAGKKVNKLPKKTATKKEEPVAEAAPAAPAAPTEEAPVNNSPVTA